MKILVLGLALRIVLKKSSYGTFRWHSKNSYEWLQIKTLDKQTEEQKDKRYFAGPSLHVSNKNKTFWPSIKKRLIHGFLKHTIKHMVPWSDGRSISNWESSNGCKPFYMACWIVQWILAKYTVSQNSFWSNLSYNLLCFYYPSYLLVPW